ncbi:uncharacterized protein LOC131184758 [Ahaetulla prasina]|uniref:uncharacterized protein LOC131184758 n=1 Tax=Ahaetulla prasina TaxID=499056 RepID=UPI0026494164|nr:uncharacterized protein LOC131184758 [Ahaetulla prasina]
MKPLLEKLISAVRKPSQLAITHCRGHQTDHSEISRGNRAADYWARQAAESGHALHSTNSNLLALLPCDPTLKLPALYDKRDQLHPEGDWYDGWWVVQNRIQLPQQMVWKLVQRAHCMSHSGPRPLQKWLSSRYCNPNLRSLCKTVVSQCELCQRNNPRGSSPLPPGRLRTARYPGEAWQVDFTELPKRGAKTNLLVFVDFFTGWPEAIPTSTQKAREVVNALVDQIIPRFGVPKGLESDNGRHFTSQVTQDVSKFLGIPWHLHCSYNPKSSAKVERQNRTLKTHLSKLCQETQLPWTKVLPIALARIRALPSGKLGLSPFEMMYGRPFVASALPDSNEGERNISSYLHNLAQVLSSISKQVQSALPPASDVPPLAEPGQWVRIKELSPTCTQPKWSTPRQVLLSTPTALKVHGIKAWIHASRVKRIPEPSEQWQVQQLEGLKLKLHRSPASLASPADLLSSTD